MKTETIMTDFMNRAAKIIEIDKIDTEALKDILKAAIHECYDAGHSDGYDDGYENGYADCNAKTSY